MFRRTPADWRLDNVDPPEGTSFLAHVNALLSASGGRGPLPDAGEPLPDKTEPDPSELSFSPGAYDGVGLGSDARDKRPAAAAAAVIDLLRRAPDTARVHKVLQRLAEIDGTENMDTFLRVLLAANFKEQDLAKFARWLCENGARREHVKVGMAMLGASGGASDIALLTRLGLLEELTLYAVVAMSNLLGMPDRAIFELAQQVSGWGRVHAVRRLANTTDPEIQRWLIRGGAENGVMLEELAFLAATTGRLRDALEGDVDAVLLDSAANLLGALAEGGPAPDMREYTECAPAIAAFLRHVNGAAPTWDRLYGLTALEWYVGHRDTENPHLSAADRDHAASQISAVLDRREWAAFVEEKLASDDATDVRRAVGQARRFQISDESAALDWLDRRPLDLFFWDRLLTNAEGQRLQRLLDIAESRLPPAQLSTGPATDLGLGSGYELDMLLGTVLQRLAGFADLGFPGAPGMGWQFIRLGLNNRVVRNRGLAVRAIEAWPRSDWPPDAEESLRTLLFKEPEDSVKQSIKKLLRP